MLGRLCKLLRMCGIDSEYCNRGITILIAARKEDRIILTRNSKFRNKQGVFFIAPDGPEQQLEIVIKNFQLDAATELFSRCLECNRILESIKKTKVRDRVPFYIYAHNPAFFVCPECQRVYWPGSHYKNMLSKISQWDIISETNK
ncbi:hypothetical protein A2Y85_08015 [candidate division WOR-3 bacterium RBG_13_43_14]|uniref:Mut7-C RNAse domain-containing protein n=1 Tax=candidate division WOR-3 bacterium RBG_13_43_14 TaxID=1802590 RepID=A0A1F4U1L0_UNCW3|nr:MAG: hypothetical protein A2Y85_08015 [candidate division WOR-3 bacterium RBG_13_43_14]